MKLVTTEQLRQLAVATYWLASLYRRGSSSLPTGLGEQTAEAAHKLRGDLRLTLDNQLVGEPVLPHPYRAVLEFADELQATIGNQYLQLLGGVTRIQGNRVYLEVK